jgi:hypothetical protein
MSKQNLSAHRALVNAIRDQRESTSPVAHTTRVIYYGEVVENVDPDDRNRIRVFIEELDKPVEANKDKLAWCQYLFASNVQHIPKVGEHVAIILENPWKKDSGRWWVGPVFENRTIAVPLDAIGIAARSGNTITLQDNGNIEISTDTNQPRLDAQCTIYLDRENEELRAAARDIVLESTITAGGDEFSVPYGERLVELLRFMLQVLKTHSHPPNGSPIPTFYPKADAYLKDLEDWLLNENVRTRGN